MALAASADMRLTMSLGTLDWVKKSTQVDPSIAGPPASAIVGTSVAPGTRLLANTAIALIFPLRTCGMSALGVSVRICKLPPIKSLNAGAVPL